MEDLRDSSFIQDNGVDTEQLAPESISAITRLFEENKVHFKALSVVGTDETRADFAVNLSRLREKVSESENQDMLSLEAFDAFFGDFYENSESELLS